MYYLVRILHKKDGTRIDLDPINFGSIRGRQDAMLPSYHMHEPLIDDSICYGTIQDSTNLPDMDKITFKHIIFLRDGYHEYENWMFLHYNEYQQ